MILLLLIAVVPVALIVVGYRDLAAAVNAQAARGVLTILIGVGAIVWLLDNISW